MNIENEIKVIDINPDSIIDVLAKKNYEADGLIKFKRYIFDTCPGSKNVWIRLRSDGKINTLTYKRVNKDKIDGVEELEVVVNNFDKTKQILIAAGLNFVSYQENSRQLFTKNKVEVSIDRWPHIPPYLEIEAKTKKDVERTLIELDLKRYKTTSLSTKEVYKLYGKDLEKYKDLKFK